MHLKSFYEMRPDEIIKARNGSGCAFIPVGPIEWHSYHLPMGTDALIAEKICESVACRVGGVYFKPLNLGVDAFRTEKELIEYGFNKTDKIFGMNQPGLPLRCEYCSKRELISGIKKRIEFVKECMFKHVFVVNHHGGKGQNKFLKEICDKFDSEDFKVEYVFSYRFLTLKDKTLELSYGGHAGISETTFLLAFYPELVDLSRIKEGELNVRETGILHDKPVIGNKFNPRNVSKTLSDELRENIINNFTNYIKETYLNPK